MKPYYSDDSVTIYHGDCREVIPALGEVDHVLTDPPYSEETHSGSRTRTTGADSNKLVDFGSISFEELSRIFSAISVRRWIVSFADWRHTADLSRNPPTGLRFVRFGVWVKPNGAPQLSGDRPAQGWESVAVLHSDSAMKWNGGGSRAVWTCNRKDAIFHKTEKPTELLKTLVQQFTDPGEKILDPFVGSGTTLRAAKDLGRRAIGIEIEERYCEIAANRCRQNCLF